MAITFCTLLPLPTESIKLASDKWEDLRGPTIYYACEIEPGYLGIIMYKFDYLRALSIHSGNWFANRDNTNPDYQFLPVPVKYKISDLKAKLFELFKELEITYLAMDRCHDLIDQMTQGLFYDSRYVLPDLVTPHINLPFTEWLNCLSMPDTIRRPEFEALMGSKKPAKMQDDGLVGDESTVGTFSVASLELDDLKDLADNFSADDKENALPLYHLDWDVAAIPLDQHDNGDIDPFLQDPVSVTDNIDADVVVL
jgi:hypothetical protein